MKYSAKVRKKTLLKEAENGVGFLFNGNPYIKVSNIFGKENNVYALSVLGNLVADFGSGDIEITPAEITVISE